MGVIKTRSRLVSFRLTQDELQNLRAACLTQGARNISTFARDAVLDLADARVHPEAQLIDRFRALESRVTEIEGCVRHNGDMLRALLKRSVDQVGEKVRFKGV
jgi:hypothetical protein